MTHAVNICWNYIAWQSSKIVLEREEIPWLQSEMMKLLGPIVSRPFFLRPYLIVLPFHIGDPTVEWITLAGVE